MKPVLSRRAILKAPAILLPSAAPREPLHRSVELNPGETGSVRLTTGEPTKVTVIEVAERRDSIRNALRQARVRVRVNGEEAWLVSGNYRLPVPVGGVQIDCPGTRGLESKSSLSLWHLSKDVRLRLWPAESPWIEPGTFDVFRLSWKWRERSAVKITERTREKTTKALHRRREGRHLEAPLAGTGAGLQAL